MIKHLYSVLIKDRETGEKINLKVTALSTDEATRSVCAALFWNNGAYVWIGTNPLYKNNKLIDVAGELTTKELIDLFKEFDPDYLTTDWDI